MSYQNNTWVTLLLTPFGWNDDLQLREGIYFIYRFGLFQLGMETPLQVIFYMFIVASIAFFLMLISRFQRDAVIFYCGAGLVAGLFPLYYPISLAFQCAHCSGLERFWIDNKVA